MGHPIVMFLGTFTGIVIGVVGVNLLMGSFKGSN
jgi:hypothetical protein